MLEKILTTFEEEEILILDGFDSAVIGIDRNSMRLIYSIEKIIEILKTHLSRFDAFEYFEFNILNAYVGEKTPIFCDDNF